MLASAGNGDSDVSGVALNQTNTTAVIADLALDALVVDKVAD